MPEALFVISKTIILQSQLKKQCSGTILTSVPKESLKEFIIQRLSLKTKQKIASLFKESHEARSKLKSLVDLAKSASLTALDIVGLSIRWLTMIYDFIFIYIVIILNF